MAAMTTFERHTLPNNLRVLTAPIPHAQSVTCVVMLAAGARYEGRDNNGIAHFAEHMFFKGTERRPTARDIAGEVDAIGGEFNAFTGKEYTGYYVRCAAEFRDTALDVLADMLQHSKFDTEEIEREKGVIIEEMNMYYDTPRDYVSGVYDQLMFGDHPLGWDTLGRKETIQAAGRDSFSEYLDTWYKPSRMVVGVGGRIEGDLVARIEELFGGLVDGPTGSPEPAPPVPNGVPRVRIHEKASDQAHLCLGVPSYPIDHPDRYALQMVSTVLGSGMSSRLFTEVRERRGLAYYIYALNHSYVDTGTLYSQGGVDVKRVDEAVETIAREFRRIADEPVDTEELEKSRNLAKGRFVLQLENPQGLILYGLRREVLEGRAPDPQEVLDALDAVTAEDVQRVAQDLLASHGPNLALIGPFEDAARFEEILAAETVAAAG
jgi:predicted Zn-dependent peptidase